jgi:hypothetical protein
MDLSYSGGVMVTSYSQSLPIVLGAKTLSSGQRVTFVGVHPIDLPKRP